MGSSLLYLMDGYIEKGVKEKATIPDLCIFPQSQTLLTGFACVRFGR